MDQSTTSLANEAVGFLTDLETSEVLALFEFQKDLFCEEHPEQIATHAIQGTNSAFCGVCA